MHPANPKPETQPAAIITRTVELAGVPSASGVEVFNNCIYVVSDDSPALFRFTLAYEPLTPVNLLKSAVATGGRIPKSEKPDLEALTLIYLNGEPALLALGSGAAAPRQRAFLVSDLEKPEPTVQEFSLKPLYDSLRASGKALAGGRLNIEGIAATGANVHLIQRGVGQNPGTLLTLPLAVFTRVLLGEQVSSLSLKVRELPVPLSGEVSGGFSGITVFNNRFFLTASVENTPDPIQDGEVLGSFIGHLPDLTAPLQLAPIADAAGRQLPLKVESIKVMEQTGPARFRAIAVTDNDLGKSELLELEITLPEPLAKQGKR